jgi:hypothetical protein
LARPEKAEESLHIRRAALLAKQSHGDGSADLAKQSPRQAQAVLAKQSQRVGCNEQSALRRLAEVALVERLASKMAQSSDCAYAFLALPRMIRVGRNTLAHFERVDRVGYDGDQPGKRDALPDHRIA